MIRIFEKRGFKLEYKTEESTVLAKVFLNEERG
jgi:hypothetical protein